MIEEKIKKIHELETATMCVDLSRKEYDDFVSLKKVIRILKEQPVLEKVVEKVVEKKVEEKPKCKNCEHGIEKAEGSWRELGATYWHTQNSGEEPTLDKGLKGKKKYFETCSCGCEEPELGGGRND